MVKVSFIVPVYNVRDYIQECLESLINQNIDSKEILIINDGSTDDSLDICERYEQRYPYIRIVTKANGGLSSARNMGIDLAKGEYLFFVDSDDFLIGDHIQYIYESCKINNLDVVRCMYTKYSDKNKDLVKTKSDNKEYYDKILSGIEFLESEIKYKSYEVIACLGLFKSEYLKRYNIRFTEGVTYEDHEFFMKCLLSNMDNRFTKKNILVYAYRDREGSITKVPKIENIEDMVKNIKNMDRFIKKIGFEVTSLKISKVTVGVLFNHLISLYYKFPRKYRRDLYKFIKQNIKYNMVKYGYNTKQSIKIFIFMYFKWLADLIFILKSKTE